MADAIGKGAGMDPASTQGGRDADATTRQALAAAAARSAARRGREALILAAIAALLGALSVAANLGDALGGSGPALGRAALGVLGVVAGVWLWRQPRRGWWLALAWALLQIPVYAWTPDGSPTLQVVSFPLAATSQVTENGRVTAYSQVGINLVGVALALWLLQRREPLTRGG